MSSARFRPCGRRLLTGMVAAAGVVVSLLAAPPSGAGVEPASSAAMVDAGPSTTFTASTTAAGPGRGVEVTLITGDRVRYETGPGGRAQVTVVEAVSTSFQGQETPYGGLYLYPDVAQPFVASGVLDRELFNITYLATHGYGDGQMKRLPVIVDYARSGPRVAARAENDADALAASQTGPVLESIGATGLSVDKAHADRFWDSLAPQPATTQGMRATANGSLAAGELSRAVDKIWLDRKVTATLDESVPLIGAPEAWEAGYDGTGTTVAVLDTGIDTTHPDLEGKVVASESFVSDTVTDGHGHGTHVASTVVGSGAASDGQYKGVAPGADLVVGKVLNDEGSGTSVQVIDGMEWAAREQGADVISMSLGCGPRGGCVNLDGTDPQSQAVNQLTASTGSLFVIAAGNDGSNPTTLGTPGVADAALTVAASNESDVINPIARFSSRGPRADGVLKPDIAAPGVDIVAARSSMGTDMGGQASPVGEHYLRASGTSMATPHVAGAAAILAQQHPDWTAEQRKIMLMSTSLGLKTLFGNLPAPSAYAQGAGRVDIARAVSQRLRTDTASISPGVLELDEPAYVVPVTYSNDSNSDLSVTVDATLRTDDGRPASDGTINVDQNTVTIPAGGSATVTVTIDGSAATRFGAYDGVVTASTEEGDSLRTPVGVIIQPPLSQLTVRLVKPAPADELSYFFQGFTWWVHKVNDLELPWFEWITYDTWHPTDDPDVIEATTAVPDGIYSISGDPNWVRIPGRQMRNTGEIIEPEVTVDGDTTITIDMRTMVPVTASADQPTEKVWRVYSVSRANESGRGFGRVALNGMPEAYQEWRYPTAAPVTLGNLNVKEGFILAQPDLRLHLRAGGRRLTLQPSYPDHPANIQDALPKFTQDTDTILATEADLDAGRDVRDALVLFNLPWDQNDPDSWEPCPTPPTASYICAVLNRAQRAAAAGAAGILLTTPKEGLQTLGSLNSDYYLNQTPVPVAWLDTPQADQLTDLMRHGSRVQVGIDATVDPAYEYKLWFRESGQVPSDMSYEVDSTDLKQVDVGYHGARSSSPARDNAGETMFSFWPGESSGFSTIRYFDGPTRRTEYYLPTGPEVVHDFGHWWFDNSSGTSKIGGNSRTLVGTGHESLDWGTVASPGQVRLDGIARDDVAFGVCAACRQGDALFVSPAATLGDGHQNWYLGVNQSVRLFGADGAEIATSATGGFPLPPEAGRYRMVGVQTDTATDTEYGRQVRTEWNFTATARPTANEVDLPYNKPRFNDPAPAAWQPVIFLNYEIPLALDNTARAGRPVWITVHAAAGEPGSGADIAGLELEASFDDGESWTEATVVRPAGDGDFRVLLRQPRLSKTTGAVTLRAHAWDKSGNEVTQTIDRAYGLRG